MGAKAGGAALDLTLDADDAAADDREHEPARDGEQIHLPEEIKTVQHFPAPFQTSSMVMTPSSVESAAISSAW